MPVGAQGGIVAVSVRQAGGAALPTSLAFCRKSRCGPAAGPEVFFMTREPELDAKAQLGIPGLDDILVGGLSRGHLYLVEGMPGTGKTTLALQYLLEGASRGESGLYITLSET